ncbi:MAG TPA: lipocalin-like domain-containing protein [Xanthobacteraceae bacterium]|nr:lipocalin-like domain-containing protein [Xanthobacteraceae bacterium]
MTRRTTTRTAGFALFLCGGIAASAGSAYGQAAREIAGTYTLVSVTNQQGDKRTDTYGPNPKGVMMLDANGRYVVALMRPDLPKFASNNRSTGTAEEYKAVALGSFTHFGTYSVADGHIVFRLEYTTFPNWNGQEQKRALTVAGDELKYLVASSIGGTSTLVWRRTK